MKAKKWLAALLAALMMCAAAPTAFAGAHIDMIENGWGFRYYLSGYIELLSYDGSARDVTVPDKIGIVSVSGFYQYPADETNHHIVSGSNVESITFRLRVGEIPRHFADNCPELKSVTLPDTLMTIGAHAFKGCTELTAIDLPTGLKSIGDHAFNACTALENVTLPNSLQTIGDYAFNQCTGLKNVTLPASLRSLGTGAFHSCEKLKTVTAKEGVQRIGDMAFAKCNNLESVKLPDSVVYLGKGVFKKDVKLTTVVLPKGLQSISSELFYNCSLLPAVDIPASVRTICDYAFYDCNKLSGVTLPAGLSTLEDYAFAESKLTSVTIPGGVTNVGAYAFYNCDALENVVVGHGVRTIGESICNTDTDNHDGYTFSGCSPYITITLPASVIEVYRNAFPNYNTTVVHFDGEKRLFDRVTFESNADKAKVKYRETVGFFTERGETPAPVSAYVGETITLPVLTAKGYGFSGWKRPSDNNVFVGGAQYPVGTEPVTLTAVWTDNENNVTFVTEKGVTPPAQTVTTGNSAAAPAGQTAGDEYLAGWYRTSDCSGEPYDFSEPVLESFNLYARWTSAPLVNVNMTGWIGWQSGCAVVFRDKFDDETVFASFTGDGSARVPADAVMEIIAADGLEYSGAIVSEIPLGDGMFELRTVNIVNGRSRYTPNYGSAATVNVAFTFAPRVVAIVVGDGNLNTDGLWALTDGYDPPHTLTDGSPVTLPDENGIGDVRNDLTLTLTVPEGYGCDGTIFNGVDEIPVFEGKTVYGFTPQGVVTLNLHFYKKADYVTLTFAAGQNDGRFFTLKYPKAATETETVDVPACPYAMEHGAFDCWSADVGGTAQKFYYGCVMSLPPEDTVFTAVWVDVRFISFNKNGGEGSMEKRAASNLVDSQGIYTAVCPACGFTRSGHVFTGWNTKKNGTGDAYFPIDLIDIQENITLYAQWAQAWTVRLHPNYDGGDDYIPQEIERGKGAALNAPFTREGYVLSGWNTAADGSGTSYAPGETITPTRDISLYAQWHEHDYQFDSFVWAADNKTAQAKLVCAGDETHVVYEAAEMTAYARGADCEDDACTVYEAFYGDNCDTRTVTEEGSALGHDYGQPEWKWTSEEVEADAGDGETMIRAEMEVICSRCGETFTTEADVEGETTAQPTETEPGQITYTAIAFIDDTEYTAEKTEAIPALGLPADEATEALIAAIGEVTYTPDCRAAIEMARALYDSLTAEEQALVDNYETLTAAEEAFAALWDAAAPEKLNAANVTRTPTSLAYTGEQQQPEVTVTNSFGDVLAEDEDYTVTYPASTAPGRYLLRVDGIGRYTGTIRKEYTVREALSAARVTRTPITLTANGGQQQPTVTVTNAAGETLTEGVDYKVTYPTSIEPGSYMLRVDGMGYYTGHIRKAYTVKEGLAASRVTRTPTVFTANGEQQQPTVTVVNAAGDILTEGVDYKVVYPESIIPGRYLLRVDGLGNYTGHIYKEYKIK